MRLVNRVIEGFEEKTEVFDTVRAKLEPLIAALDGQAAEAMKATEKQLEQVEGLAVAKAEVARELGARLAAHPQAPRPVIEFVGQQWIKHLVITRARDGDTMWTGTGAGRVLVSTFLDREGERVGDAIDLRGDEGVIVALG